MTTKARQLLTLDWKQAKAFLEKWVGAYGFEPELSAAKRDALIAVLPESRDDVTDLILRYAVKGDAKWAAALVATAVHPSVEAACRAVRHLGEWHDVDSLVRVAKLGSLHAEVQLRFERAIEGLTPAERKRFAKGVGQKTPDTGTQATPAQLRQLFVDGAQVVHYGRKHPGKTTKSRGTLDVKSKQLAVFDLLSPTGPNADWTFEVAAASAQIFTRGLTRLVDFGSSSTKWDAARVFAASLSGLSLADDSHRAPLSTGDSDALSDATMNGDEVVSLRSLGVKRAGAVAVFSDYGQLGVRVHVGRNAKGKVTEVLLEREFGEEA